MDTSNNFSTLTHKSAEDYTEAPNQMLEAKIKELISIAQSGQADYLSALKASDVSSVSFLIDVVSDEREKAILRINEMLEGARDNNFPSSSTD